MLRSIGLGWCVLLAGCLDFNDAHQHCVDAGRCGATGGAGGDSGSGGAGGGGGAGGYDGGTPCGQSPRPRLQCAPPRTIATGGNYDYPSLTLSARGLFAAWLDGRRVEAHLLAPDGGDTLLMSETAAVDVKGLAANSEGDAWAVVYTTAQGQPLRCFSSGDDGGVSVDLARDPLSAGIAVEAGGGVGLIRGGPNNVGWAITDGGCPRTLATYVPTPWSQWVGGLHVPNQGREGFRFSASGYATLLAGSVGLMGPAPDGGLQDSVSAHAGRSPHNHASTLSASRSLAFMAFSDTVDESSFDLNLRSLPVNLNEPVMPYVVVAHEPWNWSISDCGPGCIATTWTPYEGLAVLIAYLSTDDPVPRPRGGLDGGWDVACGVHVQSAGVAAAFDGQLRFLVTDNATIPASVKLYTCDVPPP